MAEPQKARPEIRPEPPRGNSGQPVHIPEPPSASISVALAKIRLTEMQSVLLEVQIAQARLDLERSIRSRELSTFNGVQSSDNGGVVIVCKSVDGVAANIRLGADDAVALAQALAKSAA